jgi:xanthine/CO dehydrogenase XdhC/CoxF family maturation factor
VAFEVVTPAVRLLVCGSGPDAVPVVRFATQLGWNVSVIDHRPVAHAHPERFPDARVIECADPVRLGDAVPLAPHTTAVVMSHHFGRDTDYVQALLAAGVAYVGVLGPRSRTDRVLAELAARGVAPDARTAHGARLYGPVGLDVGGDGPEAIALAVVAEVSAVASGRTGGHLRDRSAPLHGAAPITALRG